MPAIGANTVGVPRCAAGGVKQRRMSSVRLGTCHERVLLRATLAASRRCEKEATSDDAVFSQQHLLVSRYPSEDLGLGIQLLDKIVDVEINRGVGLVLAEIGRSPGNMRNAVVFIHWRNAESPYAHL